jgi:hypothetical protein
MLYLYIESLYESPIVLYLANYTKLFSKYQI